MTNVVTYVLVSMLMVINGCTHYSGTVFGSHAIPGSTDQVCLVLQYGEQKNASDATKRTPLFAVLWIASRAGNISSNGYNMLTAIHGHAVSVSHSKSALYSLQPDHSLVQLSLSREEVVRLLSLIAEGNSGDEESLFVQDPLWLEKVQPFLKKVETPTSK